MKFHGETIDEVIDMLKSLRVCSVGNNGEHKMIDYRYKSAVYGEITIQNGEVKETLKEEIGNGVF